VLRTELEGWLLPKLAEAPAVNLAHELGAADPHLPEGSPERLAKGLSQIRRGKPKKEIVHPPYAGDILWAFRVDERHRHAVGCDSLDEHELRDLCSALLATPTDSVTCLRLLAKAQAG